MHIAEIAAKKFGCILVDSTRRGKQYPDSFYATVPIWCAILNAIVFGSNVAPTNSEGDKKVESNFVAPPWMPLSQQSAIESMISQTLLNIPEYLKNHIRNILSCKLCKLLRPFWVSPVDGMLEILGEDESVETLLSADPSTSWNFSPVILLSVSEDRTEFQHREEGFSWFYVKGAGDDHENWCRGLTPSAFWSNQSEILFSDDPLCVDETADRIVGKSVNNITSCNHAVALSTMAFFDCHCIGKSNLYVADYSTVSTDCKVSFDAIIFLDFESSDFVECLGAKSDILRVEIDSKSYSNDEKWIDIFSSCLAFYINLFKKCMHKPTHEAHEIHVTPKILIYSSRKECNSAQLAVVVSLLLFFFDIKHSEILSPSLVCERLTSIAKCDVQIWSGLVQSQSLRGMLSRTLLKELIKFFVGCGNMDSKEVSIRSPAQKLCNLYRINCVDYC